LQKLGYRQQPESPPEFYETHHHGMPFFHPRRGIWVEVHRQLFPSISQIGAEKVFGLEHLKAQLRPAEFQGRKVTRLSNELQIVYIAAHWAVEFRVIGGVVAILDLIYLLKNTKNAVHWEHVLDWLDGSVAAIYLYLILSYLEKYQLIDIPPEILYKLFLRQRAFGRMNLKIVHALMDRYFVEGRAFGQVISFSSLSLLWETLLLPGPPFRNLILVPWRLLSPRRWPAGYSRVIRMLGLRRQVVRAPYVTPH
jgi:hypothetical protein